jgi:hypothetical protein
MVKGGAELEGDDLLGGIERLNVGGLRGGSVFNGVRWRGVPRCK